MGKTDVLPLLTRCVHATPTPTAAMLLYRICYWQKLATMEWDGHVWIAKSREDWIYETGLSIDQYKRAVTELRRGNLVQTEKHFFHNRQVTFTRLLARGQVLLNGGTVADFDHEGSVQICTNQGCTDAPTYGADMHHSIYKGDTKGVTKGDTSTVAPSGNDLQTSIADDCTGKYAEGSKEAEPMKIADYLKSPSKKPKSLTGKKDTLPEVWIKKRSEMTGVYQPPLKAVECGQLKKFGQFCPKDKAEDVMLHLLKEWSLFTSHVKSAAGLGTVPSQPHIGFMLKHVHLAIQFWEGVSAQPEQQPEDAGYVPEKSFQPVVKKTKKKMTPEELAAILSEDEE